MRLLFWQSGSDGYCCGAPVVDAKVTVTEVNKGTSSSYQTDNSVS